MTKHELVAELAARLGLSRAKAGLAIEALFGRTGILPTELSKGSRVQITGFGQFEAKTRAARSGRDPRTGRSISIARSTAPVFRPGKPLRDLLNKKR
ncbi:MAG TPA: HU family DNA-binding protein [Gemmatimonadales bacterium]|nr:HU family DNA-binding protein [Gemmatimonadales bacterium]